MTGIRRARENERARSWREIAYGIGPPSPAYRDTVEARIPEGVEEELLPQYVPVAEVGYGLVTVEVSYPAGDVFHSQGDRPDTVVRVSVEPGVLGPPSRVVLDLVLVRGLREERETQIEPNPGATGDCSPTMTNLKEARLSLIWAFFFFFNRSFSLSLSLSVFDRSRHD